MSTRTIEQATAQYTTVSEVSVFAGRTGSWILVCVTGNCQWRLQVWGEKDDAERIAGHHTRKHCVRGHA